MSLSPCFRDRARARFAFSLPAALAVLALGSALLAQTTTVSTGSIRGTVTDPSGAAVQEAKVTLTNKDTAQVTSTTTSSTGSYSSGELSPGNYVVRVEKEGFRPVELSLAVRVSTATPGDIRLEISTEIRGTGASTGVNTEQATVQGVITRQQIEHLPVNRNFLDLARLEPGVQIEDGQTFDPTKSGFASVSMGGRAGRAARIEVDGVDISDENVGTTTQNIAYGSMQEFQVAQSSLDLSSGLTSSGTVNIVTRSGTDRYHGDAFATFRDKRAGGADFPGGQDNYFQRNVFGGTLGGPVIKDRLFFFLAGERFKQDLFAPVIFTAPFTALSGGYNSPFRETELNGRLDYSLPWHSARFFYKFTYDNNLAVNGFGGSNFQPFKNGDNTPAHAVGLDFNTGSLTHSVRFAYNHFHNSIVDASRGIFDPAPAISLSFLGGSGFASGANRLAPQTTFQSNKEVRYDGSKTYGDHVFRYGFGLNRIESNAFASFYGIAPQVSADTGPVSSGVAAGGPLPGGINNPLNYPVDAITIGNGFGCFTGNPSFGRSCGGLADTRIQFYVGDTWKLRSNFTLTYGVRYVRDTGRADQDLAPIPCSATTAINCTGNLLDQFGFVKGLGNRINQPNLNFGPQLGLAWDPHNSGKTVFRAGIGLYYDNTVFNNILFDRVVRLSNGQFNAQPGDPCASGGVLIFPNGSNVTSVDGLDIASQICGQPVGATLTGANGPVLVANAIGDLQKQFQAASAALGANSPNPFFLGQLLNGQQSLIAPDYRTPRAVQMNIGFQHEIRRGTVLSVDYVRNVATHYLLGSDTNHVGDARFLNVNAALSAINATLAANAPGCPAATSAGASSQAAINCYMAAVPSASIADFASHGLDSGGQFLGGFPAVLQGLTPDTGAAFPGINPLVGRNTMYFPGGRSVYKALQMSLRSRVSNPARGFNALNLQFSYAFSRFESNVAAADLGAISGDQDFLPIAADFNHPTGPFGPAASDRTHQISFGAVLESRWGPRLSLLGNFASPLPQTLYLPASGGVPGEIFRTDFNGDGEFGSLSQTGNNPGGDILPGTGVGSFGRDVSVSGLNNAISDYNTNLAGKLTPAGAALVTANLLTGSQLASLGAVMPAVQPAPPGNIGLAWLKSFDVMFLWPLKVKERFTLEPSFSAFNVFNYANFDSPTNRLNGILNGAPGNVNGTTSANRSGTRTGVGSGVFTIGAPRQMEFGLRVIF